MKKEQPSGLVQAGLGGFLLPHYATPGGHNTDAGEEMPRLLPSLSNIAELSDEDAIKWLMEHPISGGDHTDDDDDDDNDSEDDDDGEEGDEDDDGDQSGKTGDKSKKPDGKKPGKLYTKDELDAIVEKAVTDRLKRAERNKTRDSAKDKGEFEKVANDLQREIDEEWKPKAQEVETLQAKVDELSEVVTEQIDSILDSLPKDLQDLDLGEDEEPVKRLRWLITKVMPKARKRKGNGDEGEDKKKSGNPPSPTPRDRQGKDEQRQVPPPVSRKKF